MFRQFDCENFFVEEEEGSSLEYEKELDSDEEY